MPTKKKFFDSVDLFLHGVGPSMDDPIPSLRLRTHII